MWQDIYTSQQSPNLLFRGLLPPSAAGSEASNIVVLWIVRLLALPVIVLLYVAGFVLNLLYGICGSIGMILAGLGGFAAFLALLDGSSYAQAAASALVALLLCPFAAPMLLSLAGSALIVAASALFAWLF